MIFCPERLARMRAAVVLIKPRIIKIGWKLGSRFGAGIGLAL